jgi:hypothetical protein
LSLAEAGAVSLACHARVFILPFLFGALELVAALGCVPVLLGLGYLAWHVMMVMMMICGASVLV